MAACLRCGTQQPADLMVRSRFTGHHYCRDWSACDRRALRDPTVCSQPGGRLAPIPPVGRVAASAMTPAVGSRSALGEAGEPQQPPDGAPSGGWLFGLFGESRPSPVSPSTFLLPGSVRAW